MQQPPDKSEPSSTEGPAPDPPETRGGRRGAGGLPSDPSEHYELADPKELGRVIRRLRKQRELTQRELAARLAEQTGRSVDHTFISLVENGNRLMSFPTFMALSRAFDVPGEWLIILAFRNVGGRDRGHGSIDELADKLKQLIEDALFG